MTWPTTAEFQDFWLKAEVKPLQSPPAVDRFLHTFMASKSRVRCQFGQFQISEHPLLAQLETAGRQTNAPNDLDFLGGVASNPGIQAYLPELKLPQARIESLWGVSTLDTFSLEAKLAQVLFGGGPYGQFTGTAREAKALAGELVDALGWNWTRNQTFRPAWCWQMWGAWTPWFEELSWDDTLLGLDAQTRTVWILCLTASD